MAVSPGTSPPPGGPDARSGVPDSRLRDAGAVRMARAGRVVTAHYGSIAGELAACMKRAGIIDRADLDSLELTGPDAYLDHLLETAGDGCVPGPGRAVTIGTAWCCRVDGGRAVVVGSPPSLASWRGVVRRAVMNGVPVACSDEVPLAAFSLVGPLAHGVLARAGLGGEEHARPLSVDRDAPATFAASDVGAVSTVALAGACAIVVLEQAERFLVLVESRRAGEAWAALEQAGRPLGLAQVGQDALARLRVAMRHVAVG